MTVVFLITVLCASLLVVYSQLREINSTDTGSQTINPTQEPQKYCVNITDFTWTSSQWGTPVGVSAAVEFNITIQNLNDLNITGLNVALKIFDANGGELKTDTWFYGPGVIGWGASTGPFDGVLHGNETRTLRGGVITDWGSLASAWDLGPITAVAYVTLDSGVLDELKLTPP